MYFENSQIYLCTASRNIFARNHEHCMNKPQTTPPPERQFNNTEAVRRHMIKKLYHKHQTEHFEVLCAEAEEARIQYEQLLDRLNRLADETIKRWKGEQL